MKKKIVLVSLSVLVLLLALAAIAPFVIDLNKHKGAILSRIRPALHRDVDFESIRLTILTGIGAEIRGLRIPENPAFAKGDFMTLESAQVRMKILPLLRGQIRVARIVFNTPMIHVRRNTQGVFNFADMTAKKEEKKESKLSAILATFGISELTIKNGTLQYEDDKVPVDAKPDAVPSRKNITITKIDAGLENISFTDAIAISLKAGIVDDSRQNIDLTGTMGPIGIDVKDSKIPLNLTLKMQSLPMKKLTESLGLSLKAASGDMSGEITTTGTVKQRIETMSKITLADFTLVKKPGAPEGLKVQPINCNFTGKIIYDTPAQDVTMENPELTVNASRFSISGKAQHIMMDPAWNFLMKSLNLDLGSLFAAASNFGVSAPAGLQFKGHANMTLSTAGTAKDMAVETGIDMAGTDITMGDKFHKAPGIVCKVGSNITLKEKVMTIRSLNVILNDLVMAGTGSMDMNAVPAVMNMKFASRPINLQGWAAIIPLLGKYKMNGSLAMNVDISGTSKSPSFAFKTNAPQMGLTIPADRTKDKNARDKGTLLKNLNLTVSGTSVEKKMSAGGNFSIEGGKFAEFTLGKALGTFTYAAKRLNVPSFQVNIFNGSVTGSALYMTETKQWEFNPVIKGINASQAMNSMTSFKDVFTGTLSGKLQISGNAAKKGIDSLSTKGSLAIDKGTVNNIDIARSVIDGLSGIQGLSGMLLAEQAAVQRNKETRFDSFTTDINLSNKIMEIPALKLINFNTGRDTNSLANMLGKIDMATRKIDFTGDVAFSPEYSAKISKRASALNALQNEQKRISVPIKIDGLINKPMLSLQMKEINRAVADFYAKKGIESLKKKLNVPGGDTGGTQQAVDKLLKGVFGK